MEQLMVLVDQVRRAGYRLIGQLLRAHRYCDICDRPITGQPLRGNSTDEAVCEHCWETVAWIRGPLRVVVDGRPFVDQVSGRMMVLHMGPDAPGVAHPDCAYRAEVFPESDAFYCTHCGMNGRIGGSWFMKLLVAEERSG